MNALWDLVHEGLAQEEARLTRAWAWVRETYEGALEVHTGSKIFRVPVVAFSTTDRGFLSPFANAKTHDMLPDVRTKRKAMSVTVAPPEVKSFEVMAESGATFPWVAATLRIRGPGKGIAWMLGMRNAMVIGKHGEVFAGLTDYLLIGESINEMMPKSLVAPPAALQG